MTSLQMIPKGLGAPLFDTLPHLQSHATGHADYVNVAWLLGKISPNHFDELLLAIVICDNVLKHEINQQLNPMSAKK